MHNRNATRVLCQSRTSRMASRPLPTATTGPAESPWLPLTHPWQRQPWSRGAPPPRSCPVGQDAPFPGSPRLCCAPAAVNRHCKTVTSMQLASRQRRPRHPLSAMTTSIPHVQTKWPNPDRRPCTRRASCPHLTCCSRLQIEGRLIEPQIFPSPQASIKCQYWYDGCEYSAEHISADYL